jgi:hypothetical protein
MKKHVLTKRDRKPTKFDALSVFAAWAQDEKTAITAEGAISGFAQFLEGSLKESLQSDTLLYGNRTQALFEAMVANLGAVELVKSEDNGDVYAADSTLEIPDTRIVLADGRNLLVETKNVHGEWDKPYRKIKATYLDGLVRYAQLVGCELRIAIFWSKSHKWTLVPGSAFTRDGKYMRITFLEALTANEMGTLGDKLLGCGFPVIIRGFVEKRAGKARMRFDKYRYFIGKREITDSDQQCLLFFLMLWGEWGIEKTELVEENDTKRVTDVVFMPIKEARGGESESSSGCVLNAFLSTVLSRYWLQLTNNTDGKFRTLLPNRDAWNTQMLRVTDESSKYFAIATVLSPTQAAKEGAAKADLPAT